nr:peptidoglycan-binding protein [Dyella sp. ASV24]
MDVMSRCKIIRLVATQGKMRVYEMEDRSWLMVWDGTVAWRNNNPGRLKFAFAGCADDPHSHVTRTREEALGDAQQRYQGLIDLDPWGNAVFESYDAGREAQKKLLREGVKDSTVEQLVLRYSAHDYSGSTHHANQVAIIHATAAAKGLDLHGKMVKDMTPLEINTLADGLAKAESWKVGAVEKTQPLSDEQLRSILAQHAAPSPYGHAHRHHDAWREGDRGPGVAQLQQDLITLGVNAKDGRPLVPDQHFGPRTREAVEAFQRLHGLPADGVAGSATIAALARARALALPDAPSLLDARHPAHNIFKQAYQCVARIDQSQGRTPGARTQMFAGSLTSAALGVGMSQIDHVVLSEDASLGIAVQGPLQLPFKHYASVNAMEAAQTPLDLSSRQAAAHMELAQLTQTRNADTSPSPSDTSPDLPS